MSKTNSNLLPHSGKVTGSSGGSSRLWRRLSRSIVSEMISIVGGMFITVGMVRLMVFTWMTGGAVIVAGSSSLGLIGNGRNGVR